MPLSEKEFAQLAKASLEFHLHHNAQPKKSLRERIASGFRKVARGLNLDRLRGPRGAG